MIRQQVLLTCRLADLWTRRLNRGQQVNRSTRQQALRTCRLKYSPTCQNSRLSELEIMYFNLANIM